MMIDLPVGAAARMDVAPMLVVSDAGRAIRLCCDEAWKK